MEKPLLQIGSIISDAENPTQIRILIKISDKSEKLDFCQIFYNQDQNGMESNFMGIVSDYGNYIYKKLDSGIFKILGCLSADELATVLEKKYFAFC